MRYDLIDSENNVLRSNFKLTPLTPSLNPGERWVQSTFVVPEDKPKVVSIFQATEALADAGYLSSVEAYFASEAATAKEKRAWNRILEVQRDSPLMSKLATMLNLTEGQVDALSVAAAEISA